MAEVAFMSLDEAGRESLRGEPTALWALHNRAINGSTMVAAEYLQVMATKA